jgi:hypothetical protein
MSTLRRVVCVTLVIFGALSSLGTCATYPSYDIGTPSLTQIYVNPVTGNDANAGTLAAPVRSIGRAWRMVPDGTRTQGMHYRLCCAHGLPSSACCYSDDGFL